MWRDRVLPTGDVLPPHPPPKNTTLLGVAEKEDCACRSLQGRSGALGYLRAKVALRSTDSLPRGHRGVRGSLVRSPASLARPTSIAVENCNCPPSPQKERNILKNQGYGGGGNKRWCVAEEGYGGHRREREGPTAKKIKGAAARNASARKQQACSHRTFGSSQRARPAGMFSPTSSCSLEVASECVLAPCTSCCGPWQGD